MRPPERYRLRALAFTSLAHFLNDSFLVTLSVLVMYYVDMHVPVMFVAAMGAVVNVLSGLASPVAASYADRRGLHNALMYAGFLMIAASSASFAASFVVGGAARLALIGLGSVLLGLGLSTYHPLGGAILQHAYGAQAGRALGINGSFGSVGRAVFPALMVLLITALGGGPALALIALYVFVVATVVYVGLRPIRMPASGGTMAQGAAGLRAYAGALAALTAVVFVRSMFMGGATYYMFKYLEYVTGSKVLSGIAGTVAYATAIGGQPLFGWMTARYGGRAIVYLTTLASTVFYVLFLLTRSAALATTTLALFALFAMSGFPVLLGYVNEIVDPSVRAQANSLVWGIGNTVGGAVGIIVGGAVWDLGRVSLLGLTAAGVESAMWLFALFAVASSAMLPLLPRGQRARRT